MLTGGFLNRGKHVSFQRSKHALRPNTSLIKIEGVDDPKAATFYNGKRIAYVYRGKKEIRGTKIRVIWGKVTRPHGTFLRPPHPRLELLRQWRGGIARHKAYQGTNTDGTFTQATPVSSAHSSSTTSPPRASAPWSASCSTPARYKCWITRIAV